MLTNSEIQQIEEEVGAEIEEAVNFSTESSYPAPKEALQDVYERSDEV